MLKPIGHVRELVRFPIKSMAGVPTESALLGWHGLDGDRRFAFRRLGDPGGFPWLTAGRLPELVLYRPFGLDESSGEPLPTHIGREAGMELDPSRFRANILLETYDQGPFVEDGWVGERLVFGDGEPQPALSVTTRDERCMMINLDPDTARQDGRALKAVVRMNANYAGVYATVVRAGTIRVGQAVSLVLDDRPGASDGQFR